MNSLELLALNHFPLVEPGDDLSSIIFNSIKDNELIINENDVIVIAITITSFSLIINSLSLMELNIIDDKSSPGSTKGK